MTFDWVQFLTQRHIPFVTTGPSVTRGNVAIRCPFCADDQSEHLAIGLHGEGWHCWRNRDHSGRSPARLVAALLRCSMEQAHSIVGTRRHLPVDFASKVRSLVEPEEMIEHERVPLTLPKEFHTFEGRRTVRELPFARYLNKRGFEDVVHLSGVYGLRYARNGPFAWRIIFPVYFNGDLVTWTGRSLDPRASLRYKTLSPKPDEEKRHDLPLALGPISDYLLWYDELPNWDADTICLVEGPFDALNLNVIGERCGLCSTCFFTTAPSETQVDLLHELLPKFRRRYLLQDAGAEGVALKTRASLTTLGVKSITLPPGAGDPGVLTENEVQNIFA